MKNIRFMLLVISLSIQNTLSSEREASSPQGLSVILIQPTIKDKKLNMKTESLALRLRLDFYTKSAFPFNSVAQAVGKSHDLTRQIYRPIHILYGLVFGKIESTGSSVVFDPIRGLPSISDKSTMCESPDEINYVEFKQHVDKSLHRVRKTMEIAYPNEPLINLFARTAPSESFSVGSYINYVDYQMARLVTLNPANFDPQRLALIKTFYNGTVSTQGQTFAFDYEKTIDSYEEYVRQCKEIASHHCSFEVKTPEELKKMGAKHVGQTR